MPIINENRYRLIIGVWRDRKLRLIDSMRRPTSRPRHSLWPIQMQNRAGWYAVALLNRPSLSLRSRVTNLVGDDRENCCLDLAMSAHSDVV